MDKIVHKLDNGGLKVTLSREIYKREAVMEASYKFTGLCTVLIKPSTDKGLEVIFEPKKQGIGQDLDDLTSRFCNEVLDQQIRLDLEKRYGKIRELIVKHALSPLKDLKELLGES